MGTRQIVVIAKVVLVLVVAVLLQTLLISHVSVLGVTADLFLIFTVVVAVRRGSLEGAVFGFFAGLVADIAYYQLLGVRAFIYVLTGYFVGMFVARFGTRNPWSVALLAGASSLLAQFLYGLFQYAMGPRAALLTMIGTQMLPEAVIDGLITAPLYVFLVRTRLLPTAPLETAVPGGVEE
jgi:rod shape-determining protein MreD